MIIEVAQEEIPTFECFQEMSCSMCTANDWYCPSICEDLEKAKRMPFSKIQAKYAAYDGDLQRVFRYIKQAK